MLRRSDTGGAMRLYTVGSLYDPLQTLQVFNQDGSRIRLSQVCLQRAVTLLRTISEWTGVKDVLNRYPKLSAFREEPNQDSVSATNPCSCCDSFSFGGWRASLCRINAPWSLLTKRFQDLGPHAECRSPIRYRPLVIEIISCLDLP